MSNCVSCALMIQKRYVKMRLYVQTISRKIPLNYFYYSTFHIFQVRSLCRDWFPIEYPQSWYEDITSSERFFALAAVYKSQIIGLIVAEIKPYLKLNAEDRGILSRWFASKDTLVAYILSLGKDSFHYNDKFICLAHKVMQIKQCKNTYVLKFIKYFKIPTFI